MTNNRSIALALAAVAVLATSVVFPAAGVSAPRDLPSSPGAQEAPVNHYVGTAKCKLCHDKPETGSQYGTWHSKAHARAHDVLATEQARKVASEHGIEDPQKSADCLRCHVTAFGVDAKGIKRGFDVTLGVQCESCHGPGGNHMQARLKDAAAAREGYVKVPAGEIVTAVPDSTCATCHNEQSPTFQPLCPHEGKQLLRHLNPKKPRTDAERAALAACTCETTCVCKKDSAEGQCRSAGKPGK